MATLTKSRLRAFAGVSIAAALVLTGCSASPAEDNDDHDHDDHTSEEHGAAETAGPQARLAMTYDGGVMVVDAATLETVAELEIDGFNRINAAGDGRHALVSTQGGWQVLDVGTWTEPHGDHTHSYAVDPALTDLVVEAETPAHVVNHDGNTILFDDGTGAVTVLHSGDWGEAVEHGHVHTVREYQAPEAHHGVAVTVGDDMLFVTSGSEDGRDGAVLLDANDEVVAQTDQCPGIHGETTVGDIVVAGCEDGVLILHDGQFHKIDAPDDFGRVGNAFSTDGSEVVLGDYKNDPDAGIELRDIALIDTEAESMQIVDTETTYTWRGLARGMDDSALVLGTDGSL
ncbi:MAG TPA: hypothetical protein IAA98_05265, partial [Candidatus Avipropionibacterium avicola]|nr:hypothetical protein [Candidatus Avipropionibacterium avicola]